MTTVRDETSQRAKRAKAQQPLPSVRQKHGAEAPKRLHSSALVSLIAGGAGLIFGQTYTNPKELADTLQDETQGRRDIAFLCRGAAPRAGAGAAGTVPRSLAHLPAGSDDGEDQAGRHPGLSIRKARRSDEAAINAIYSSHGMVPIREGFIANLTADAPARILVAEDKAAKKVVGVVMGVDHKIAFDDPENGASLWALAVDLRTPLPGIGQKLVQGLAFAHQSAGRSYMDLSVMHDNTEAIALYHKLGFVQVPVFSVKNKNQINERLFIGPEPKASSTSMLRSLPTRRAAAASRSISKTPSRVCSSFRLAGAP